MAVDGKLMVLIGEAFVEVDEDAATAHVEKKTQVCSSLPLPRHALNSFCANIGIEREISGT